MREPDPTTGTRALIAIVVFACALLLAGVAAADPQAERKPAHHAGSNKGGGANGDSGEIIGGSRKGPSAHLSRHRVKPKGGWRRYVINPGPTVYPKAVDSGNVTGAVEAGSVENPSGLAGEGGGVTTINSTARGAPYLVLDLGVLTGGRVQVAVSSNSGVGVRLSYSEARRFLTDQGDINHGSQGRNDDPGGRLDFLPPAPGAYTLPGVRGSERYVLIELEGAGNVQIDYVRVAVNHLQVGAGSYVGHFLSSDDLLNRIWYTGAYTLNLDTYGDPARGNRFAVTDGAKHDRLVWVGDLPMEYLIGAYTVRQLPAILRRSISMFTCQQEGGGGIPKASDTHIECPTPGPANGPPSSANGTCTCVTDRILPEYTAWFVVAVAEHYRFSGDESVSEWLPVVRRAIKYFSHRIAPSGLFVTGPDDINWHVPDIAAGEDGNTNAVWVRALSDASYLEKQLGSRGRGRRYGRAARKLAGAMMARLYDPNVAALRLNPLDPSGNHTQDVNVQSILAGVLNGAGADNALNFIQSHLWTQFGTATGEFDNDPYMGRYISPWVSGWEVIARFERGRTESALSLIRRLWGRMTNVDPGNSVWEKMTVHGGVAPYQRANQDGSPIEENALSGETSLAHGWSGGATGALSAYVLGLRPVGAGWQTWIIQPQPGGLDFAQGQVGTPHGILASRWAHNTKGPSFRITVKVPAGTGGTVAVPLLGKRRTIGRDGELAWDGKHSVGTVRAHRSHDYVVFHENEPGLHTYAWAAGHKKRNG